MAKQETIQLIDDLVGGPADETVEFGLDGRVIAIDLASERAKTLREGLLHYAEAGTIISKWRVQPQTQSSVTLPAGVSTAKRSRPTKTPPRTDRELNQRIREWAKKRGMTVSERGRIPASVIEAYNEEN